MCEVYVWHLMKRMCDTYWSVWSVYVTLNEVCKAHMWRVMKCAKCMCDTKWSVKCIVTRNEAWSEYVTRNDVCEACVTLNEICEMYMCHVVKCVKCMCNTCKLETLEIKRNVWSCCTANVLRSVYSEIQLYKSKS